MLTNPHPAPSFSSPSHPLPIFLRLYVSFFGGLQIPFFFWMSTSIVGGKGVGGGGEVVAKRYDGFVG